MIASGYRADKTPKKPHFSPESLDFPLIRSFSQAPQVVDSEKEDHSDDKGCQRADSPRRFADFLCLNRDIGIGLQLGEHDGLAVGRKVDRQ